MSHLLSTAPGSSLELGNFLLHSNSNHSSSHCRLSSQEESATSSDGELQHKYNQLEQSTRSPFGRANLHQHHQPQQSQQQRGQDTQEEEKLVSSRSRQQDPPNDTQWTSPLPHDIIMEDDSHPGTKVCRLVVRAYVRKQQISSIESSFTPFTYTAILQQLRLEQSSQQPPPVFYTIVPHQKRNSDDDGSSSTTSILIRAATTTQKIDYIKSCYYQEQRSIHNTHNNNTTTKAVIW